MEAKCPCEICGQPLAFDVLDAGSTIDCPHCQQKTKLVMPKFAAPTAASAPRRSAPAVAEAKARGKIEDTLESIGGLFLFAGIIVGLLAMIGMCFAFADGQAMIGFGCAVTMLGAVGQGIIVQALFRAFAEVIRLLRAKS